MNYQGEESPRGQRFLKRPTLIPLGLPVIGEIPYAGGLVAYGVSTLLSRSPIGLYLDGQLIIGAPAVATHILGHINLIASHPKAAKGIRYLQYATAAVCGLNTLGHILAVAGITGSSDLMHVPPTLYNILLLKQIVGGQHLPSPEIRPILSSLGEDIRGLGSSIGEMIQRRRRGGGDLDSYNGGDSLDYQDRW